MMRIHHIMSDIYNFISSSKKPHNETYCDAIIFYDKSIVDFIMYDLFEYAHDDTHQNKQYQSLQTTRIGQDEFRNALIKRYGKCIITDDDPQMCQACHIIPFKECNNYQIDNGLLMTASLHKLFDDYDMTIDHINHIIKFSKNYSNWSRYHGKRLDNISNVISKKLKIHNERFIMKHNNMRNNSSE